MTVCASVAADSLAPALVSVFRYFGGRRDAVDKKTRERIEASVAKALTLASPAVAYTLQEVRRAGADGRVSLASGPILKFPPVGWSSQTGYLAVAVATLGAGLEIECRHLAGRGRIYQSTLLDAVGTAMLDRLDSQILQILQARARALDLYAGCRFAPGLNGYPLERQTVLFELVDAARIGVQLNQACIMDPAKSISFFQLMSDEDAGYHAENKCEHCHLADCQFRKPSQAPHDLERNLQWPNKC